jgi:acetyl esterase/lipase
MTDPLATEAAPVDPGSSGTLHPFVAGSRAAGAVLPAPPYEPSTPVEIRDVSVPGLHGAPDFRVRIYTPTGHEGKLPGLLFLHGGAFILSLVDFFDSQTTRIAAEVGAVVVSVDYRVAPEAPFPAGMEDGYAALEWMVEHVDELGVDPQRIGIAGESAGANLAAAVALAARDRNGPRLTMQYLGLPVLDDRLETPSMNTFVDTPGFNRRTAAVLWDSYLGGTKTGRGDDVSLYAAPARAEDLAGLPPTYIALAEFDPLRDEGFEYARRLIIAGVPTELRHFPGASHGVSELNPGAEVSRRMIAGQLDALRRGLHGDASGPSV